jgi:tetratricopeptide (TPR) repeat protein
MLVKQRPIGCWGRGFNSYQTGQFPAALNSWQQALQIYRTIKNRQGEGRALGILGSAYLSLGNYAKAIEYSQQSLAIAREIKDRQGEGLALGNLGALLTTLWATLPKPLSIHSNI